MKRIIYIFIFSLSFVLLSSCDSKEEEKHKIPWAPVNYTINIEGADHDLKNPATTKTYPSSQLAGRHVGFSGLLVVCGLRTHSNGAPMLYVYDLCCPNEGVKDKQVIPSSDGLTAKCPHCNTEFDIISGLGNVKSGTSPEGLQRYQAIPENPYSGRYTISRIN